MMEQQMSLVWYKQLSRTHWHALFGSWLGWALDGFDFILITYVLADVAKEFHFSLETAGTLVLATFATRWLGGALIGSVADRIGRKNAMVAGILLYSIATGLCGLSWDYWSLLVFRLLVGVGMAGEYAAGSTLLLENWPQRLRNKASGFLVSGWAMGGILAATTYAPVVGALGWRGLFFIGVLPALLTIYIRFGVAEPEEWQQAVRETAPKISFLVLFSKRWLGVSLSMVALMFANFATTWPILGLMPTYLKSTHYPPEQVGLIMSIASFGALLGYCASGFLGDRLGTRRALIWGMLVSLIFIALMFLTVNLGTAALSTDLFLIEFTSLGITGLLPKYIAEQFDPAIRAAGLGTTYNIGSIAGGLSPVWGAALAGIIGLGPAIALLTGVWTVVVVLFLAVDVPRRLRARHTASAVLPITARA